MHAVLELPALAVESRTKMFNHSQKCLQPHALENIACSSLCELSQSICRDDASGRKRPALLPHYDHNNCSPWKLKKEEISLEAEVARIKKNINMKARIVRYNSIIVPNDHKENFTQIKPFKCSKEEAEVQRYPSIFVKLRAAKEAKSELSKKQKSQTEIITIMRKRKSTNREELDSKKITLAQQIEDHSNNLKLFNKKIEDLQILKKHSLNTIKQAPYCVIELEGDNPDRQCSSSKPTKINLEHWKSRKMSVKCKKTKKTSQSKETRSIDRRDNKENIPTSKKTSFSLEKPFKQEYQSSNPLTRLLYEKYINTIHIHPNKQDNFHFL